MTKILAIQGSDLKKVNIRTDTTILLATEAQKKGYKIYYFEPENLSFLNGKVVAKSKYIKIYNRKKLFRNISYCRWIINYPNFFRNMVKQERCIEISIIERRIISY